MAAGPATWAQEPAPDKSPEQTAPHQGFPDQPQMPGEPASYKIQSNVQLVTTPVTVFDSSGQFVYDLDQDEFKILDNGQHADCAV